MQDNQINRPKPVVLVILDGWGVGSPYQGNAITNARTPFLNELVSKYPAMTLAASGESVGLPWGENGNSEVGHLNLGAGRIVYQDMPRINKTIADNTFYKNPVLLEAAAHVKQNNSALHIMGLVSSGGVHSSLDHLHALLVFAKENKIEKVYIHAMLDGRDTAYNSGVKFVKSLSRTLNDYSFGKIATISGRFYAMDRNNNWDRINRAYIAMTEGVGNTAEDPVKAIEASYRKKIYDEEFVPTVITDKNGIPLATVKDNDAVIFFNFRPDRARQLTRAFTLPQMDKFDRKVFFQNLYFATFTEYEVGLPVHVIYGPEVITNTLGEVISKSGLKQLRIAETEKYAHVTYFFNGGREEKSPGEEHVLIPSPQVESYDQKPEMSAIPVADRIIKEVDENNYDFILVNFANADMVGHTANIEAAIVAVETLDQLLKKIVKSVLAKDGAILITADHGNAEVMFNLQTGMKDKEHSANPVPFLIVRNEFEGKNIGWLPSPSNDLSMIPPQGVLADVAPTILKIMNLEKPAEMSGRSLVL